ncbi:mitochondrial 54S ribosomal protein uL29m MRPL4 [Sporobolomyces salmoneus]|uniref:mitochondrial 54S ribosomal protein uL29m MRPL4 n=1 Tax=Sporobolomyces salmoneus TaxID=183962 RepID=UPI0031784463
MSSTRLLSTVSASLPRASTSSSVSTSLPVLRSFSSSPSSPAQSTAFRPKRDETKYGVTGTRIPRSQWPKQSETNTDGHPLWKFFHNKESLEEPNRQKDYSSRSWTSFELRRKSFEELHALWYVLLRERNVLLTQREEARRLRVDLTGFTAVPEKLRMCQKSMARVKQTISERRHAALEAAEILRNEGNAEGAEAMELDARRMSDATRDSA